MTSNQILTDALNATVGETNNRAVEILGSAIADAMDAHRTEVLNAFNEGENQGFASASLDR